MNKLWSLLKKIPRGKVTTYGILSKKIRKHPRAVARLLSKNKNLKEIPCYKVIYSSGRIGGYKLGVKRKFSLLKKDGIEINNGKIDLKKFLYKF